ncbi:MAG TPA: geranylgeranyl reductase family protein [Candidatus Poseidoniales archaeon]|nr:MAG TPA: geranylgeranyl reductase family protein [Candidatus Poseidoniales archaeon]HII22378.1 geranylgeranyl reductase family protein [Candidatus Poseidoniaceae archaeon]
MLDRSWDVIIVGAGPTGGRAATHLASLGHSVLMLEEHNEIGRPFQCAGLVTPKAMHEVELYDSVLQEIDGARIHGPDGTLVPVGTEGKLRTYVVCRKQFDQGVVQQAMQAGATLSLNSTPVKATATDDGVDLEININGEIVSMDARLLIGCDGAHSWTRRNFKMGRPNEMMIGFQTEVQGYEGKNRWLEMYSGSAIAPGFFAWVIPSGFGSHRIGVWSTPDRLDGKSVEQCYEDLLNHEMWHNRFENITETARYCGPIPSGMVKKTVSNRVILLGDAAGMAKPTTGGGIGPGFRQIKGILKPLSEAIKANELNEKQLHKITNKHFMAMKKDQDKARALRNLLVSDTTDKELNKHFTNFAREDVLELINEIGDIEKPVPLGLALIKKVPAFRRLALRAGTRLMFR